MEKKVVVVTTTINVPTFLDDYIENARVHGHKNVKYIVVGDKKTPLEAREFCERHVIPEVLYMGEKEQKDYLQKYPDLDRHLPWNSIARRNIGHLWAYEMEGADIIIMLDDDNLATDNDFVKHHSIIDTERETLVSQDGWINPCVLLKEEHGIEFYPRGYAPSKRWQFMWVKRETPVTVGVNAGLWIGDPDVDAITRLERKLVVTGFNPWSYNSVTLYPGTWCPWNCQNTSLARRVLPAYFLSPHAGRHLDIWASYVVSRIMQNTFEGVNFGQPLANHVRSPHNLYRDLEAETPWIEKTDEFCDNLRNMVLTSDTYLGGLEEVASQKLADAKYMEGLEIWGEVFSKIGGK